MSLACLHQMHPATAHWLCVQPDSLIPPATTASCLLQKFPAAAERIQGVQVDQPPAMADLLSDMHQVRRQEGCPALLTGLVPDLGPSPVTVCCVCRMLVPGASCCQAGVPAGACELHAAALAACSQLLWRVGVPLSTAGAL